MKYLGLAGSRLHDAGMTLIDGNGDILFASQTERFTSIKHDSRIPRVMWENYYEPHKDDITVASNDDWELRKKFRDGELILAAAKEHKVNIDETSEKVPLHNLHPRAWPERIGSNICGHHKAHAAACFMTRPESFDAEDCVMVVIDGIGEYRSGGIFDHNLNMLEEFNFPRSIGYLYATFTETCGLGLTSNEDEYVIMGLSSYGEPTYAEQLYEMFLNIPQFDPKELSSYIETNEKGNIQANTFYAVKMMYLAKTIKTLLRECSSVEDAAASLQKCTEMVICDIMHSARKYGKKLCYSGGVAQNICANNHLHGIFEDVWVDINPGDGGASLGCAAWKYREDTGRDRINWKHPYLGYNIEGDLDPEMVVDHLLKHKYCGVANGPAEFSYRAYGNRSLIADVRHDVKDTVNTIKRRQKYRPFAPAILEEHAHEYFSGPMNRWMQYAATAKHDYSSVTHVDGTGRVQLVPKDSKSVFRKIIECYYEKTGVPMLLNTSLNIRGKPMVNDIEDAMMFENKYDVKVFTK